MVLLARRLLADAGLHVQVGGGLVGEDAITEMLDWGAARVVVGVRAAADGALLDRLCARHGADRLAAAVETDGARLKPRGAAATPIALSPEALVRHVAEHGVRTIVYTDVTRDGSLGGPDLDGATAFVRDGMHVIASGGVGSLADLTRARDAGLAGVIVGRALHEGRFTLAEALACL